MLAVGLLEDLKNEPYLQREVLEPFSGVTWKGQVLGCSKLHSGPGAPFTLSKHSPWVVTLMG